MLDFSHMSAHIFREWFRASYTNFACMLFLTMHMLEHEHEKHEPDLFRKAKRRMCVLLLNAARSQPDIHICNIGVWHVWSGHY